MHRIVRPSRLCRLFSEARPPGCPSKIGFVSYSLSLTSLTPEQSFTPPADVNSFCQDLLNAWNESYILRKASTSTKPLTNVSSVAREGSHAPFIKTNRLVADRRPFHLNDRLRILLSRVWFAAATEHYLSLCRRPRLRRSRLLRAETYSDSPPRPVGRRRYAFHRSLQQFQCLRACSCLSHDREAPGACRFPK